MKPPAERIVAILISSIDCLYFQFTPNARFFLTFLRQNPDRYGFGCGGLFLAHQFVPAPPDGENVAGIGRVWFYFFAQATDHFFDG